MRALEQIARRADGNSNLDLAAVSDQARDATLIASSVSGGRVQEQIDLLARRVTPAWRCSFNDANRQSPYGCP